MNVELRPDDGTAHPNSRWVIVSLDTGREHGWYADERDAREQLGYLSQWFVKEWPKAEA